MKSFTFTATMVALASLGLTATPAIAQEPEQSEAIATRAAEAGLVGQPFTIRAADLPPVNEQEFRIETNANLEPISLSDIAGQPDLLAEPGEIVASYTKLADDLNAGLRADLSDEGDRRVIAELQIAF